MAENNTPQVDQPTSGKATDAQGNLVSEAKNFIKNPLGIIGLFIILVYATAALVAGVTMFNKGLGVNDPITWFIIGFPVLVLVVFFILVVYYHTNLYAPSDFLDTSDWIELQKLLYGLDKQADQMSRALGTRAIEFADQQKRIDEAKSLVDKAISKALRFRT